jgi:hypothetical protein
MYKALNSIPNTAKGKKGIKPEGANAVYDHHYDKCSEMKL